MKPFCRFAGCLAFMKRFPRRVFESERDYIEEILRCRNILRLGLLSWTSRYPIRKLNCDKKGLFYDCFREGANEANRVLWLVYIGSLGHIINSLLTKREVKWLNVGLVCFVFFCLFIDLGLKPISRHLEGDIGGTQYRNTLRKIMKYRNTISKITEITDTVFMIAHSTLTCIHLDCLLSQACICMH